jgi:hypothetical protein
VSGRCRAFDMLYRLCAVSSTWKVQRSDGSRFQSCLLVTGAKFLDDDSKEDSDILHDPGCSCARNASIIFFDALDFCPKKSLPRFSTALVPTIGRGFCSLINVVVRICSVIFTIFLLTPYGWTQATPRQKSFSKNSVRVTNSFVVH